MLGIHFETSITPVSSGDFCNDQKKLKATLFNINRAAELATGGQLAFGGRILVDRTTGAEPAQPARIPADNSSSSFTPPVMERPH
jgi:hypothetical protein